MLRECHDDATASHLGIMKTIHRVAQHYYWPGVFRETALYMRHCQCYQQHKPDQCTTAGLMRHRYAQVPGETLSTNLIGLLLRSSAGHTWLSVCQDIFTKWIELKPLRNATASAVAQHARDYPSPEMSAYNNNR